MICFSIRIPVSGSLSRRNKTGSCPANHFTRALHCLSCICRQRRFLRCNLPSGRLLNSIVQIWVNFLVRILPPPRCRFGSYLRMPSLRIGIAAPGSRQSRIAYLPRNRWYMYWPPQPHSGHGPLRSRGQKSEAAHREV